MQQTLIFEVFYPYPLEQVWHALTDQQTLAQWMMDNDFELLLGHRFQFQDRSLPGLETVINCEVIAIEAPHRLVYTWKDCWRYRPSLVTWILVPVKGGTHLKLHHNGLATTETALVTSPASHLTQKFGQDPVAYAVLDDTRPPFTQSVGSASLSTNLTSEWDYRLNQVLPTVFAKSTINPV